MSRTSVVVGGGIVGTAVARELARGGDHVVLLEKEPGLAAHQSGHNSGVVHAGLYYAPGSLKSRLCRRGNALVRELCRTKALPLNPIGKVVVATHAGQLALLDELHGRALRNGVSDARMLDASGLRAVEPNARGVAAIHSPSTAITDFAAVTRALADDVRDLGGELRLGTAVRAVEPHDGTATVVLEGGDRIRADLVVVCAGVWGDQLAEGAGESPDPRIVPFRGAYWTVVASRRNLVRGLVYPVPDPTLPFLGVHFTPTVGGEVLVGPTALIAPGREAYRLSDGSWVDARRTLAWPGTWRMLRRHAGAAARELGPSVSAAACARQARRLVPGLTAADLSRGTVGIRAQAVGRDGSLVDDFVLDVRGPVVHVRNAPSPAATSSLAIAEHIRDAVDGRASVGSLGRGESQ